MEHFSTLISIYGYWILFPLMILEGPIVTVMAAFLASLGILDIMLVYILSVLGNVIGDINYYSIGRFGREKFIKKYGKYIGLHEEAIKYLEEHYKNHFLKTILIAKATEAPVVPTLVAAGIVKTDFKRFVLVSVLIEIPKAIIVVATGYYFGRFYQKIEQYFNDTVFAFGCTAILFVVVFVLYKKIKKNNV